ncbi:sulfatase [Fictibacillus macauensis ZFHKF-1]|uniref:Sulfatase n=1 Tax=Fictibacillus macauensis ZFHKF-1 TaxID=1196324 RepID=I8ANJ3_9BACL|nr:LTA synthase family protein [Fictibacillus macauensis]EIT87394.1 sulfatase [Fictibacillus macauensis ZFHKF-1]
MHYFIFLLVASIKIYLFRGIYLGDFNFQNTLLLEIGYIAVLWMVVEWMIPAKGKALYYMVANLLLSLVLVGIALYDTAFNRIPTAKLLIILGQLRTMQDSLLSLFDGRLLFFFIDLPIILVLILLKVYPIHAQKPFKMSWGLIIIVVAAGMTGWNIKQTGNKEIDDTLVAAKEEGLFTYETVQAFSQPMLHGGPYRTDQMQAQIDQHRYKKDKPTVQKKKRNLIAIQVESLQNFVLGKKVNGQMITPHLNQLLKESYYFKNVFHQVGPGNTSDAEFLFNTSLYTSDLLPMSSLYANKQIPSLPRLLQKHGYKTSTMHAGDITYWNRHKLYASLGFQHYYDRAYFGSSDPIGIGASDQVFFDQASVLLKEQVKKKTPFYSQLITLSSHSPYELPESKQKLDLPSSWKDTEFGRYLQAIHYTDQQIGRFMEQLKKEGLLKSSLLVIYGDHNAPMKDVKPVSTFLGHTYDEIDKFTVPFIIHDPAQKKGKVIAQVGGQVDMMPTVSHLLGISLKKNVHFGHNLLTVRKNTVGFRYYLPNGSFVNQQILFVPGAGFKDGRALDLRSHRTGAGFTPFYRDYLYVKEMGQLSDQYVDSLPQRTE